MGDTRSPDPAAAVTRLALLLGQQRPQPGASSHKSPSQGPSGVAALILGTNPGQRDCGCAAFGAKAHGRQEVVTTTEQLCVPWQGLVCLFTGK